MTDIMVALGSIVAIGFIGVLLPVGLIIFEGFSTPKIVKCPKDGKSAQIRADTAYASDDVDSWHEQDAAGRSRWREEADGDQSCLRRLQT